MNFVRPPLCDQLGLPLPYDTGGRMVSAAAVADPPGFDRARVTRGNLELKLVRTDLAEVLASAVETSMPLIEANGHELSIRSSGAPLPCS